MSESVKELTPTEDLAQRVLDRRYTGFEGLRISTWTEHRKAVGLIESGSLDAAQSLLERAIAEDPKDVKARFLLTDVLYLKWHFATDEAEKAENASRQVEIAQEGRRLEPESVLLAHALARGHFSRRDIGAARMILEDIRRHQPDQFFAYENAIYNLACALALQGEPEDSLALLAKAEELDPSIREVARLDPDFASVRLLPSWDARSRA